MNGNERYLSAKNPEDLSFLIRFLNLAGERMIEIYSGVLKNFGKRLTFTQTLGDSKFEIHRTMFGFSSMSEAFENVLWLEQEVASTWLQNAYVTYEDEINYNGIAVRCKQTCVPSMSILFPNAVNRLQGQTNDDALVWVFPFSVVSIQSILSGMLFDWQKLP